MLTINDKMLIFIWNAVLLNNMLLFQYVSNVVEFLDTIIIMFYLSILNILPP